MQAKTAFKPSKTLDLFTSNVSVTVTLNFEGKNWGISPNDML